ncbi:mRNA 3' end processing factor [Basidiobolus ranarum]|uniref:mRNA 3' end processing factor n=1 Tax=Basidiobolus ranarum TaxID=34480 RepID=A0ABR2WV77_9FUNG
MNPDLALETVRQQYRASLADLTFNSKPIITNLTILAQEHINGAKVIVQTIEDQIRRVHPRQKLPVFYLLDSICKNVGGAYVGLFSRNIVKTYLDTFFSVDQATQKNLERVLGTWKNGPNGPLFPPELISNIERSLFKYHQRHKASNGSHMHVNPSFVRNSQKPASDRNISQRLPPGKPTNWRDPRTRPSGGDGDRALEPRAPIPSTQPSPSNSFRQASPTASFDSSSKAAIPDGSVDKHNLLTEIQALIGQKQQQQLQAHTTATQNQIQILQKLQTLVQSAPLQPNQVAIFRQQLNQMRTPVSSPAPAPLPSPQIASTPATSGIPSTLPTFTSAATPTSAANPADLVQNLMAFGLLGSNNLLNIPKISSIAPLPGLLSNPGPKMPPSFTRSTGIQVKLSHEDIQKKRPGSVASLYEALALQCTTCGFRYQKNEAGRIKMDQHLDWHFRQNRRLKEKAKKIQSRTWFVSEEDWIHSRENQASSLQAPAFFDQESNNSQQETDDESALKEMTIVVPHDHHGKPCPVCKEKFVSFWSDSEEEWMYKNAVLFENVVYHATCHADAQKNDSPSEDENIGDTNATKKRKIDTVLE